MAIFITKVLTASTQVNFNYLDSEAVWGLTAVGTYEFVVSDFSRTDEEDVLIEGIDALKGVYLQQNIVAKIGADEYVNGIVTSLNFPDDNHVDKTPATITIEERRRVENAGALSDILNHVPSPQDVESFSESFSFQRGANNYSRSRDVSLKYRQDAGDNFIDKAKIFLKNIFLNSRPSYGFQEDGISEEARFDVNYKPVVSEFIDILNKEVRLTESIETNRVIDDTLPFSVGEESQTSLDERGYTTKRFNLQIKALSEPLESNIQSGVALFLDQLYQDNTDEFGLPIQIERGINTDGGRANLSVSFTNDPSKNGFDNVSYTVVKAQSESWDKYDLNLDIISKGPTRQAAFESAKEYWSGSYDLGYVKVPALFPEVESGDLNEQARNTTFKPFDKGVSEIVTFTTDTSYGGSGDSILKKKIQISDQNEVDRHKTIPILGANEILSKRGAGKTLATRSISVELVGKDFASLEQDALNIAEAEIPDSAYYYQDKKTSTHDPVNGVTTASVTYLHFD